VSAAGPDKFTLVQSDFPRELAAFVDFVGAEVLTKALGKVIQKLESLSPKTRLLFSDRYFFHEQFIDFVDHSRPFRLDVSVSSAVRAASLVAGINRVKVSLSSAGADRLRSMVMDNLKPDRDMRQLEQEIRCATHFGRKGYTVTFADLEGLGAFDLLVETGTDSFEVECKAISEDTGSQIKSELTVNLCETFRRVVLSQPVAWESGIFILTLKKPADDCRNLAQHTEEALATAVTKPFDSTDFGLIFAPRPGWGQLLKSTRIQELDETIALDSEIARRPFCAIETVESALGLSIRGHKPNTLSRRLVQVVKEGADQCTGLRPSIVWLHFVGFAEPDFLRLAEFSRDGRGAGLNNIVARSLHPEATSTDRSHVHTVRFSAKGDLLSNRPILAPSLLIVRAISSDGPCYDVPNPLCRFPQRIDL